MLEIDSACNIKLTRGDTGAFQIDLIGSDDLPYIPQEGDSLRFAMAKQYAGDVIIEKDIPIDTLLLKLEPEDTKSLDFGSYVYDIQFTSADGDVSTIILSKLTITKEVA